MLNLQQIKIFSSIYFAISIIFIKFVSTNFESSKEEGKYVKTGRVATALAQIMAYHKQPQSYNGYQYYWDKMPMRKNNYDDSPEAYNVAYLMSDIVKTVSMKYGSDGSFAYSTKCKAALKKFGYTCTDLVNYNQGDITSSLDLNRPVYNPVRSLARRQDTHGSLTVISMSVVSLHIIRLTVRAKKARIQRQIIISI